MSNPTTSVAVRFWRLSLLLLHIMRGVLLAWLVYPRRNAAWQRAMVRTWAQQLLATLNVDVRALDAPQQLPPACMLVSNHISWLDIFAIDAVFPSTFIGKAEIRGWPVVGWLCTRVGTLYIERTRKSDVLRANHQLAAEMREGRVVAICPEGTTTFGDELLHFHAGLFEPAVEARAVVQPVSLRYLDAEGRLTRGAGYVGEMSLLDSLIGILSEPYMCVELGFTVSVSSAGRTRRELANEAETLIAARLGLPRKGPGTALDPRAVSQ
jgi:1-acyl-sn-glycerol-3-phosphate acyltransferase